MNLTNNSKSYSHYTLTLGKLIMRQLKSFISIIIATAVLSACSSSQDELKNIPSETLFEQGQTYLKEENYSSAVRYLEAVDGRFRDGQYREETQLSLMKAYYSMGEYYQAIEMAERFVRSNPYSDKMDYVYYLAGLSNVRLGDNFIQDFFKVNRSSRAVKSVRNAYGTFQTIVQHFPNSEYAAEAQQWMIYLKNRLAEHELEIVKYYQKRKAYVAMANRVEEMIRYYPDCKADSAQETVNLIKSTKEQKFETPKRPEYREGF